MLAYHHAFNFHRRVIEKFKKEIQFEQFGENDRYGNIDRIENQFLKVNAAIRKLCQSSFGGNQIESSWQEFAPIEIPERFARVVSQARPVSIYDVGPREQAQRLSTVSRAADAVSLALALAGNAPQAGINAAAGIGFSRQASGKADALERVPQVVAYARAGGLVQPGYDRLPNGEVNLDDKRKPKLSKDNAERVLPSFGWVLGPRAGIDPKGRNLTLNQAIKPYDLSVDLSLPAWWPSVRMRLRTIVSPDWGSRDFASWATAWTEQARTLDPRYKWVTVPLVPNVSDLDALTDVLLGMRSTRSASVDKTYPATVKACSAITLVAEGRNLWRATGATLAGKRIDASKIAILPNMGGIEIAIDEKTVTKASVSKGSAGSDKAGKDVAELVVLTPYGVAPEMIEVTGLDGCKEAAPAPPEPKVAISGERPSPLSLCAGQKVLTLNGKGFALVKNATLGAQVASKVEPLAEGKQLRLTFDTLAGVSNADSMAELVLNGADGELLTRKITVNNNCPAK